MNSVEFLAFVLIVIILFVYLVRMKTQLLMKPWKILFLAIITFVAENILTIINQVSGKLIFPQLVFAGTTPYN